MATLRHTNDDDVLKLLHFLSQRKAEFPERESHYNTVVDLYSVWQVAQQTNLVLKMQRED
jgi:hypothetical protein